MLFVLHSTFAVPMKYKNGHENIQWTNRGHEGTESIGIPEMLKLDNYKSRFSLIQSNKQLYSQMPDSQLVHYTLLLLATNSPQPY